MMADRSPQTTIDYHDIYSGHAEDYDLLVTREDYLGNILPSLEAIRPLPGSAVADRPVPVPAQGARRQGRPASYRETASMWESLALLRERPLCVGKFRVEDINIVNPPGS